MSLLTCGFNSLSASDHLLDESAAGGPAAAATARPDDDSLRWAFHQAQTRARQLDEKVQFIFEHVDREMKSAVQEVQRAKQQVRRLRIVTGQAIGGQNEWLQRSASDQANGHARGESHPPVHFAGPTSSPHPYLAALATPHASPASSPVLQPNSASARLASMPVTSSPSMPSLRLGAPALSPRLVPTVPSTQIRPPEDAPSSAHQQRSESEERSASTSETVDGSYCLLPFGSSEGVSDVGSLGSSSGSVLAPVGGLPHSASHQAMLEAQEAMADLHRDRSPLSPADPASLQTSPVSTAHAHFPPLPALHTSASSHALHAVPSPQSSTRAQQVLATSPFCIAPSAQSPPIHPTTLKRKSSLGSSGLARASTATAALSPTLGPQPQPVGAAPAPSPSHSLSAASASSPTPALASALRSLREAQLRFESLAHFCAPLVLRSQGFTRLKEREALKRLGVLEAEGADAASSSDDDALTASQELQQLEQIAQCQAAEGSGVLDPPSDEERKSGSSSVGGSSLLHASSLVMVSSPSSPSPPPPPPASRPTAEQQREAMAMYIRKLRAEVLEAEEKAQGAAGEERKEEGAAATATAGGDEPLTMKEALEGCILLHDQILQHQATVERLQREQEQMKGRLTENDEALQEARARASAAEQRANNLNEILAKLNIPVDEKGRIAEGFDIPDNSRFWRLTSLTLAFGSLFVASALTWRRILLCLYEHFPSACSTVGASDWIRGLSESAGIKAAAEAATQTAAAATAASVASQTVPESVSAATSAAAAASYASARPSSVYIDHQWPIDRDGVIHIDVGRFPNLLNFLSQLLLTTVVA